MLPPASTLPLKKGNSRHSKALPSVPGAFPDFDSIPDVAPPPPPRSKDRKSPTEVKKISLNTKKSLPEIRQRPAVDTKKSLPDIRRLPATATEPSPRITTELKRSTAGARKPLALPKDTPPAIKKEPASRSLPKPPQHKTLPAKPELSPEKVPASLQVPSARQIHRKAVGHGTMAPVELPADEPSPAISISSLYSAYGRAFDSPVQSEAATTMKTSTASSRQPSPLKNSSEDAPGKGLPPVPPHRKPSPAKEVIRAELPAGNLTPTSPQQTELWRRRPQTSKNRELPELNLEYSNGSTNSIKPPSPPAKDDSPAKSARKAPPAGLPGRNIRPAAAKGAKGTSIASKASVSSSETVRAPKITTTTTTDLPSNRPPTPEYRKNDKQLPTVEVVKKPASPVSSPESPNRSSPDFSKQLPPQPPKHGGMLDANAETPRRKPVTSPNLSLQAKVTSPDDSRFTSTRVSDVSSTVASAVTARTSQSETSSTQDYSMSSRSESRATEHRKPMDAAPPRRPGPDSSRMAFSESQGSVYRGRDGTVYREMITEGEPDPRALYFPSPKGKTLSKDAILPAPMIKMSHYNCFQRHKTMQRRSNRSCPLKCQTCEKADMADRWACSFCHLRLCESCFTTFGEHGKDINRLMTELATAGCF